jgi:PQQ-dependent dehydrogenase (s-GDH family)
MNAMSIPSPAWLASIAVPVALLSASLAQAQVAPGPGVNPRTVWSDPPEAFSRRLVADGLDDPWEVTWGPDEHLWMTERTGKRVVRVDPVDGTRKVAVTIEEVEQKLGQDGLLGLALHSDLLAGSNYVYVMYTYDADSGADDARRAKIRRYTYNPATETLVEPLDILTDLPHGPDHGASRIVFGPDAKLYASRGDHGANFLAYYCEPIRAQELPVAADVAARNWRGYEGKVLRVELDGAIPADNPVLNGVRSHVFSYGHRNPQGMAFGPDGRLYASEHGQDTDDEVNRIDAGRNYGWPLIAGFKDDLYYTYANWSASAPTPCASLTYGRDVPSSVPQTKESDVDLPDFTPPIATFFTVPSDYDVRRLGNATAALAGLEVYASPAIPGWNPSILVAGLTTGTIYRLGLNPSTDAPLTYFKSQDRYRDLAIAPDGRRIYVITDSRGRTLNGAGEMTAELANPGALIEFTYTGARQPAAAPSVLNGAYTEEQAIRGRALYYEHCLQCHDETMAGVDKAPPLAGPQFSSTWNGAPLAALVARILTMPPEKPGVLLPEESVDILAYILWYNGLPLGDVPLASGHDVLGRTTFQIPPRE